jgi:hypothetical protein
MRIATAMHQPSRAFREFLSFLIQADQGIITRKRHGRNSPANQSRGGGFAEFGRRC